MVEAIEENNRELTRAIAELVYVVRATRAQPTSFQSIQTGEEDMSAFTCNCKTLNDMYGNGMAGAATGQALAKGGLRVSLVLISGQIQ